MTYSTKQQHQTLRSVACKNRLRPLSTNDTRQSFFAGPARFADPTRMFPAALPVACRRHFRAKTHTALDERIDVLFADVRNKRIFWVHVVRRKCRVRATLAFPLTLHRGTCLGRSGRSGRHGSLGTQLPKRSSATSRHDTSQYRTINQAAEP